MLGSGLGTKLGAQEGWREWEIEGSMLGSRLEIKLGSQEGWYGGSLLGTAEGGL